MKKTFFKLIHLSWMVLAISSMIVVSSCSKDDDEPDAPAAPLATFQFEVDELTATFTNYSSNATSYAWDFGDNAGTSTEMNPTYTYTDGGTYTVTLTATGGTATANDIALQTFGF